MTATYAAGHGLKLAHEFPFYQLNGRYLGMLFAYVAPEMPQGLLWTHSILSHGMPGFASQDDASADFCAVKQSLPDHVHRVIFGS